MGLIPNFSDVLNAIQVNTITAENSLVFIGIPLFQVKTLEIKNSRQTSPHIYRSTPIFFEKNDADCATLYAYSLKEKQRVNETGLKIDEIFTTEMTGKVHM